MARPRKKVDAVQVEKLARIGCSTEEIADIVGCSHDTITRRFASELARARANRKMSLRRAQYIRATRDRSDTMLIHLGKVELGQGGGLGGDLREILAQLVAHGGDGPGRPGDVPE